MDSINPNKNMSEAIADVIRGEYAIRIPKSKRYTDVPLALVQEHLDDLSEISNTLLILLKYVSEHTELRNQIVNETHKSISMPLDTTLITAYDYIMAEYTNLSYLMSKSNMHYDFKGQKWVLNTPVTKETGETNSESWMAKRLSKDAIERRTQREIESARAKVLKERRREERDALDDMCGGEPW